MPRSSLLAEDDDFDLAGGGGSGPRQPRLPPLLPVRGVETGSVFHEGVWPPPSERSRLEDPIRAGSNVDLNSIVDDVMGTPVNNDHSRWSSTDTAGSSVPLLPASAMAAAATGKRKGNRPSFGGGPSETSPLNPGGHDRQRSIDSNGTFGSPSSPDYSALPPGAAAPILRGTSVSTTGSPRTERRAPSGFGSLMVVNASPSEEDENAMPLVDLTPGTEEPLREIPPLYHMIRRDTEQSLTSKPSSYSQVSNGEDEPAAEGSTAAGGGGADTNAEQRDGNDETTPTFGQAL
ncbi:hypothetical protein M422DRAFT_241460 [Sphaerobolus stellatus SS14]|nr:hypothetical protein M422DRAFT_241460 [Sphaerobolus stellatus SS14]